MTRRGSDTESVGCERTKVVTRAKASLQCLERFVITLGGLLAEHVECGAHQHQVGKKALLLFVEINVSIKFRCGAAQFLESGWVSIGDTLGQGAHPASCRLMNDVRRRSAARIFYARVCAFCQQEMN